ncbi:hypothetical protein ACAG08_22410, partial [Escherichia coli]
ADRNRSHWSTSKTPSYTKSVSWQHHLLVNISITELVEKVANSGDPQAKSMLKQLLENSTVASIVGAGASALLGLL